MLYQGYVGNIPMALSLRCPIIQAADQGPSNVPLLGLVFLPAPVVEIGHFEGQVGQTRLCSSPQGARAVELGETY